MGVGKLIVLQYALLLVAIVLHSIAVFILIKYRNKHNDKIQWFYLLNLCIVEIIIAILGLMRPPTNDNMIVLILQNPVAAFVYHGSQTGLSLTPDWSVESNQSGAWQGHSVSTAGDVNGDGYADVIVGAPYYDNGQSNEGVAFVYHGSASGISTTASALLESDQANAQLGLSVSGAGDVKST